MRHASEGARRYLLAAGAVLLGLAAVGWVARGRWFSGDPAQSAIHAALGTLAVAAAFWSRRAQAVTGLTILLLGLGALGTLTPRLFGYPERLGSALRWEVLENAAHIILGGWGAYVASREKN